MKMNRQCIHRMNCSCINQTHCNVKILICEPPRQKQKKSNKQSSTNITKQKIYWEKNIKQNNNNFLIKKLKKEEHVGPSWSWSYGSWIYNQQPVQSVPIITKVLSSNLAHGEVYSISLDVVKFDSDLRQVGGFLSVSSTNKTDHHNIVEILLKVALNTINPWNSTFHVSSIINIVGRVMVSMFALSTVNRGFEYRSGQPNDYNIVICCFSGKFAAIRSKSKDLLTRNQNNVPKWSDVSTRFLNELTLYTNIIKRSGSVQSRHHYYLIEM
jgi:hypothetical protein